MKLSSKFLAVLIFVVLFGGIAFTTGMGWWQTVNSKTPATYTEGDASGQYNPADIRGSYTFGEISELFGVPLADLGAAFGLQADSDIGAFQVKSLEGLYAAEGVEIGTDSVRLFVAWYKGLPFEADDETYLPLAAAEILRKQASLSPEQTAFLEKHSVGAGVQTPVEAAPQPTPEPTVYPASTQVAVETHAAPEGTITGKTTFQNLLDWGVEQAEIEALIGEALPAPETVIKDYVTAKGLEFSSLKTQLQALVE